MVAAVGILCLLVGVVGAWWLVSTPKPASQPSGDQTAQSPPNPAQPKDPDPPRDARPPEQPPQDPVPSKDPDPPKETRPPDREPPVVVVPPEQPKQNGPLVLSPITVFTRRTNHSFHTVAFSPDGLLLAGGGSAGVRLWDMAANQELPLLQGQAEALAFAPDGKTLAYAGIGKTIRLWDVVVRRELKTLNPTTVTSPNYRGLAFSPDGKTLALASGIPIPLLDVASGKTRQLPGPRRGGGFVDSVAYSSDGQVLAVGGQTLMCWDTTSEKAMSALTGHTQNVWAVAFSHAGQILASGGGDCTIILWDRTSGQLKRTLTGHTEPVSSVAFSPNDRVLVSGAGGVRSGPRSQAGEVKVWDVDKGTELASLKGPSTRIASVAIAPDGTLVAAAGADGTMALWDIAPVFGQKPRKPGDPSLVLGPRPIPPKPQPPVDPKPPIVEPKPPAPPVPETPKVVRTLPSPASEVLVAAGGRLLIVPLPKERKLAVFDVKEARIVKYLPSAEDDVKVAAGLDKLIVVAPTAKVIQRYNLQSLEREATEPIPGNGSISRILMGSASRGPLLMIRQGEQFQPAEMTLLDPNTFKQIPTKGLKGAWGHQDARWRISGNGQMLTSYNPNQSPQSHAFYQAQGDEYKSRNLAVDHNFGGHIIPGPEGRFVYTARGVFTNAGQPAGKLGSYSDGSRFSLPAAEGEVFSLRIDVPGFPHGDRNKSGKLFLHLAGEDQPLAELPGVEVPRELNTWGREPFGIDQVLFLIPSAKVLVVFPASRDRLEFHPVDPEQLLTQSNQDYLVVLSRPPDEAIRGKRFVYSPVVKSTKGKVEMSLDSGPPGMRVSADGKVTWDVPADFAEKEVFVILTLRGGSGKEVFHTFKISIPD